MIAPTNMRTMDTDICEIKSTVPSMGIIICKEKLQGYHYGDYISSENEFGVDMRAEIALLTRNVEIKASFENAIGHTAQEPWGCRVLVADFFENNAAMTLRAGSLNMDNVSIFRCGQKFTWKSAIKF